MSHGRGDVIVYDFDGTLVEGDIGAAFVRHLLRGWRRALVAPFAPLGFALMRFEATRRAGVSVFLFFGALGRRIDTIEAMAEHFAETSVLRPRERELAWLRADVKAGHRVVVATGAFEPLARVALRRLGVYPGVTLVASRLRPGWGGATVARHCTSEAKLRALAEDGFPPPYVRAVTDAAIDLPLLRAAREAVLVNASARCRTTVREALGSRLVDADLPVLPTPEYGEAHMPTPTVHVSYGLPRKGLPAAASVRRWVEAALAGHRRTVVLSVRYVDSDEGRALNRDYRRKDYATNVLSFPAALPPGVRSPLLGDLVICAPVVTLEALGQDKPLGHHHAHLVVHGVLHLLGMDHERSEAEAEAMEARERTILARLGIPDPYAER